MTFEEFIEEKQKDLYRFVEFWKEKNKSNPDVYPIEMGEGDWDEQFDLYSEDRIVKPDSV